MELALYCPEAGYYERLDRAPGRTGDFFTSVSVGPLFGELLAAQFARWMEGMDSERLQLVEAGAHDARLAVDILSWFEGNNSPLWPKLEYWVIEPSVRRREWQAKTLARFADRVRWFNSPDELGTRSVRGVHFSNELLDAFPVTRLKWKAAIGEWSEMGVAVSGGGFAWSELPRPGVSTRELFEDAGLVVPPELSRVLPDGFTLDIAAGAGRWWNAAALALGAGRLMTIDYGLSAEDFLSPTRKDGTLRAYRRHRLESDVLCFPGEQDLTSHVNFTQLMRAGQSAGLRSQPLLSQAQFLIQIARQRWANGEGEFAGSVAVRAFQTLTHPEHLGSRFKVLVQTRE